MTKTNNSSFSKMSKQVEGSCNDTDQENDPNASPDEDHEQKLFDQNDDACRCISIDWSFNNINFICMSKSLYCDNLFIIKQNDGLSIIVPPPNVIG